jgi:plasmid stabilization system protein ParE
MKPLEFHPEARAEALEASVYLWDRSFSAALSFEEELNAAYLKLTTTPLICSPYILGTRRAFLDRHPFFVVFRERLHDIQVVAVAHAKRRPGYWSRRLKQ